MSPLVNRLSKKEFLNRLKKADKAWIGFMSTPDIPGLALVMPDETGQETVHVGPDPFGMETADYREFVQEAYRISVMRDAERKKEIVSTPDWFHAYCVPSIEVDLMAEAIRLNPYDMFIPPGGQRVYFLSNRLDEIVFCVDALELEGDDFQEMDPEEIRQNVRIRLREAGLGDIDI